jgi:hypothetical protein
LSLAQADAFGGAALVQAIKLIRRCWDILELFTAVAKAPRASTAASPLGTTGVPFVCPCFNLTRCLSCPVMCAEMKAKEQLEKQEADAQNSDFIENRSAFFRQFALVWRSGCTRCSRPTWSTCSRRSRRV